MGTSRCLNVRQTPRFSGRDPFEDQDEDQDEIGEEEVPLAEKEAWDDVHAVLEKAAQEMAASLDGAEVVLLEVVDDWYGGVRRARGAEREAQMLTWLEDMASAHADGDMTALYVNKDVWPADARSTHLEIELFRRTDDKRLGTFRWYPTSHEEDEACAHELFGAIEGLDLAMLPAGGRAAARVAGRREDLH